MQEFFKTILAEEGFYCLVGMNKNLPDRIIHKFLGTLDDQGRLPTKIIDGKYQVPQMTDLIKHITELMDDLPPTVRKDPETFELWLLNTLIDTGVSKNLLLPIKKKFNPNVIKGSGKPRYIKKKYPKPD